ncbi:hypothetical protein [Caballeronia cordobensis]|uniref:hypothetical protein n=1 Tax=Caballeronia cordobensis TaxID=1353886 RepID=UPI00045F0F0F|nr:hypothetical protein BRPE67_BCDS10510 [Burkholderia sp. RPE67]
MSQFKASIGRDVPKTGDTRVVFSIRTARGTRMELDGTFTEDVVLAAWKAMHEDMAKRASSVASKEAGV